MGFSSHDRRGDITIMMCRNRYENEYRKRKVYCAFCDCIRFGIPRYEVDCSEISLKEKEEIWKIAKKDEMD